MQVQIRQSRDIKHPAGDNMLHDTSDRARDLTGGTVLTYIVGCTPSRAIYLSVSPSVI